MGETAQKAIRAIHHVQITIPCGAEDEARAFYGEVLGLHEIEKPGALRSRGGIWFSVGNRALHIGVEDGVNRRLTKAHVAYEVADLAIWRQLLETHGIQIEQSIPVPGFERFEFRDPFGNRVELIEPAQSGTP